MIKSSQITVLDHIALAQPIFEYSFPLHQSVIPCTAEVCGGMGLLD
jgi:hypothetical protein